MEENQNNILSFQHVETTYKVDKELNIPIIYIYGRCMNSKSVMLTIKDFKPYFYFKNITGEDVFYIKNLLEERLREKFTSFSTKHCILRCEMEEKESILGYNKDRKLFQVYKITLAIPAMVSFARDLLSKGRLIKGTRFPVFEANIEFPLRFMVDIKLHGCQWINLDLKKCTIPKEPKSCREMDLEIECSFKNVIPFSKDDIAPMVVYSFDIEVFRNRPGFPTPLEDPVIVICSSVYVIGKGIIEKVMFIFLKDSTKNCMPVENARLVKTYSERDLFREFANHINRVNPDVFTGYNISGFDWPYLIERSKKLKIYDQFSSITRMIEGNGYIRSSTFQSKAYGAMETKEFICEGRFDYDGLLFMKKGQMVKLRSYTLNAVSLYFLKDQKVDVPYDQIPILYNGSDGDRTRLAWYCLKDAILPVELLEKLMAFINGIEQSRVTGVPLKWLLTKGAGAKTMSSVLRYKYENMLIPTQTGQSDVNSEFTAGGHVEEPKRGYYDNFIFTLDFASLYPSIMIAYNICYSTKVDLAWAQKNLSKDDYNVPPILKNCRFCFVKAHIRKGVLPLMLEEHLAARKNVKNMMKNETDPFRKKVLDGRQLGIKLVCNSVYGFVKAHKLTDKDLMSAVTDWGRDMLGITKKTVETVFTVENGYPYDAYVVYGDTGKYFSIFFK